MDNTLADKVFEHLISYNYRIDAGHLEQVFNMPTAKGEDMLEYIANYHPKWFQPVRSVGDYYFTIEKRKGYEEEMRQWLADGGFTRAYEQYQSDQIEKKQLQQQEIELIQLQIKQLQYDLAGLKGKLARERIALIVAIISLLLGIGQWVYRFAA